MDNSEAAHSWGRDSLSCKSIFAPFCLFLFLLLMLNFFLALRSMLEQINSARNMGNAKAALARSNFARADQIAAEFLVRLIRLSGEDFKGALVDSVFNEDAAFSLVNSLIEQIEQSEFDNPAPERLATAFQMVLDHVLEPSQP